MESRPSRGADPDAVADQLLRITVALAIAGAGFVLVVGVLNYFAFDEAIDDFNPKLEGNVLSWISVVAAFGGALAAALHALILPARRRQFTILAAVLAFLSVDDLAEIHEAVADNLEQYTFEHIELVTFLPVFVVALVIIWSLAGEVFARAGHLLRLGIVVLGAALVVDLGATVTEDLEAEGTAWPHAIRIAVEEALEVSGWVLVSGTLTTIVCMALLAAGAPRARPGSPELP